VRKTLTVLVIAGALAGLFVSASRAPRFTAQRMFTSRLVLVGLGGTLRSCSLSPVTHNIVCGSHEQADTFAAHLGKYRITVLVHRRTVVIPSVIP
jgi:hypothetical protein